SIRLSGNFAAGSGNPSHPLFLPTDPILPRDRKSLVELVGADDRRSELPDDDIRRLPRRPLRRAPPQPGGPKFGTPWTSSGRCTVYMKMGPVRWPPSLQASATGGRASGSLRARSIEA